MVITNEIRKIFEERLIKSNVFTKEEIKIMECNIKLFTKCYALGCVDMLECKENVEK